MKRKVDFWALQVPISNTSQCDELLKSAYQNPQTFEQMHLYTQRESKGCEIRVIIGR